MFVLAIRGMACVCINDTRHGLCLWWRYEERIVFVLAIQGMACVYCGDTRYGLCLC